MSDTASGERYLREMMERYNNYDNHGRWKMEVIDRKFKIKAVSIKSGKVYTEKSGLFFVLHDALLPAMLVKYKELCVQMGADERQIMGLDLLIERVMKWQRAHEDKIHIADVDPGKEEKRVCKKNQ